MVLIVIAGYITWRSGMAVCSGSPYAAALPTFHAVDFGARAVPMLERYMHNKYDDQWKQYTEATPYRLMPGTW